MKSIGLDIGTTTICGILMDASSSEMIKKITLPNDTAIGGKESFEKLQDTERIEEKCMQVIENLTESVDDLVSIGVTGQMHGILYTDQEGKAASPLMTWQDGRGNRPCRPEQTDVGVQPEQPGKSYAELLSEQTGYRLATGFGTVTHYYNVKNNLVPKAAATFCTIPDYIAMRLAGLQKPVLHAGMAASLGLFSMERGMFDQEAIEKSGMDRNFFPEVRREEVSIGTWKNGVKVSPAFGDNQASFLGSVDDKSNILVNVGTGSQVSVLGKALMTFENLECRPFMEGHYLYVGSPLCGGYSYALLKNFFEEVNAMCGKETVSDIYEAMNEAGKKSREQGVRLLVDTRFCGSRRDPEIRGRIENIAPENFKAGALVCGVLEGICRELLDLYREYEVQVKEAGTENAEDTAQKAVEALEICDNDMTEEKYLCITGSGNGIHKNPLLQEIFCEKFGKEMKIPLYAEEASYGSALFSLYASGYYKSLKELQQMIK